MVVGGHVHHSHGLGMGELLVTVLPHISSSNIQLGGDTASLTRSRLRPQTSIRLRLYPLCPVYHPMPPIVLHASSPTTSEQRRASTDGPKPLSCPDDKETHGMWIGTHLLFLTRTVGFGLHSLDQGRG